MAEVAKARTAGFRTPDEITTYLNTVSALKTARGGPWNVDNVKRMLKAARAAENALLPSEIVEPLIVSTPPDHEAFAEVIESEQTATASPQSIPDFVSLTPEEEEYLGALELGGHEDEKVEARLSVSPRQDGPLVRNRDEEEAAEPGYEFGESFQSKIVAFLMFDTTFAQRTEGLIDPAYFASDADAAVVGVCLDHYSKYKEAPRATIAHIITKAFVAKKIRADLKTEVIATIRKALVAPFEDRALVIEEISAFAKNRAMERATIASAGL